MTRKVEDFNVQKVPLEGKNLIEASAGTGKTYSVAIMVLRLILEKDIRINEILMVTFTKAAVAELEERIRRFVRFASRYASGEEIDDSSIKTIVDGTINEKGIEDVRQKLRSAVINLDETSVMTIHSFCQQTLNEFAFETNQLFNADLLQDVSGIVEEATMKFWREEITSLDPEILDNLLDHNFGIPQIMGVISNHLDGKPYFSYSEAEDYKLTNDKHAFFLKKTEEAAREAEEVHQKLLKRIEDNWEEILQKCENNSQAKRNLLSLLTEANSLVSAVYSKKNSGYIKELFPDVLEEYEEVLKARANIDVVAAGFLDYAFCAAIQDISKEVIRKKILLNQMSFDDVITKLHIALHQENSGRSRQKLQQDLIRGLQKKYKAVFIDEFQDTDKLQYEIFNKAFGQNTIVFYIGDPKQSIYAWRKADIETYFEARRNVDCVYSMGTNFRSSKNLVAALNLFFLPQENFDTFHYQTDSGKDAEIKYIKVDTPSGSKKGEMTYNGEACVPVSISRKKSQNPILDEVIKQVSDLLNNPAYSIKNRSIRPSDIGILVRRKKEAAQIQSGLSRIGIPAVTVTDSKILQSPEALELTYVLDAVLNHSQSKINRALTTCFFNWTPDEILSLDEDVIIQRFKSYSVKWQLDGIYAALSDLIHDFGIQQKLIGNHTENGERIITNLYHLMEVLYRTANRQRFGPPELLDWLKINIRRPDSSDDELVQRIESDEEAVRITTIHSSKGLEYNIVLAPSLDFYFQSKIQDKEKIISYRDTEGNYVSMKRIRTNEETDALYLTQAEQENRRLLYVALTRAVYKCFIYSNDRLGNSTLKHFLKALKSKDTAGLIEEIPSLEIPNPQGYRPEEQAEQLPLLAENFRLSHPNWTQTSYSRLAAHVEYIPRENYESQKDEYDDFVFRELAKGAKTGTFIHDIFENVDFAESAKWEYAIERSIRRFVPDKLNEYAPKVHDFLRQVLHTEINTGSDRFKLCDIPSNELLHEMEFDFPMELFSVKSLEELRENGINIKNPDEYPSKIEGIMTGFVDLFFRHNGKFYILDWKTNYLGPRLEDYSPDALEQAMNDNNYHLQYLIYTYAVKLYLEHRLGKKFDYERDFGGILYLFVRGMREGKNSGIYFTRPDSRQLEVMVELFSRKKENVF